MELQEIIESWINRNKKQFLNQVKEYKTNDFVDEIRQSYLVNTDDVIYMLTYLIKENNQANKNNLK